ncbi:MAG: HAD family hydrolase [Methanobacteriota archaeon]
MIKAIVFDFDGTIIDSTESIWREYQVVAQQMGLEEITYREFSRQLGKPWDVALKALWPDVDVSEFSSKYRRDCESQKVLEGVGETLEILKDQYRLALLTSRGRETLYSILKSQTLTQDLFELILHRDRLEYHKPDPQALKPLLLDMDLTADEIVYVGDSVVDAEFAAAANIIFVGVLTGGASRKDFEELEVEHIISSLSELPGLIDSISRL